MESSVRPQIYKRASNILLQIVTPALRTALARGNDFGIEASLYIECF